MIRVVVSGAAGRMGRQVIAAIVEDELTAVSGALEAPEHPAIGHDAGVNAGLAKEGVHITDDLSKAFDGADVVIDFSSPPSSLAVLSEAARRGMPAVSGTTGLSEDDVAAVVDLTKKIPVVMTPNMSVGVNLLFAITDEVARVLGDDFDVEIIEAHHNQKVDAPSGTAKRLLEIVARALRRDPEEVGVHGRLGMVGKRNRNEIGVHAIRAGDIVGEHTVLFASEGERIELVHRLTSRTSLARGAVRAARWIVDKEPGLYDMQDVLALRRKHS
jgi:4-hydroxy-tetrahydrodipicolinate reductase